MNFNDYSYEFTPTETTLSGTLLYIANHVSDKCHNDPNIHKKNEQESTFIVIVNSKKSNIIVWVIYKHSSMDLTDFNSNYLSRLLENISKEQKPVFLLGDFNVNLLNYNEHNLTNDSINSLACNWFIQCKDYFRNWGQHSKDTKKGTFSLQKGWKGHPQFDLPLNS